MSLCLRPAALFAAAPALTATALAVALGMGSGPARAQAGIYTCVDAQGRRITSDRPIIACLDREQRELNASGTTKRIIRPSLSQFEREAEEAHARRLAEERQRARDAIRRDQALITRYPDQATHDADRREALSQSQIVLDAAEARLAVLVQERQALADEMEFYKKDPSKAPGKLRRAIEANAEAQAQQHAAIAAQQAERARINAKFDDELAHLKRLWRAQAEAAASVAPAMVKKP